MEVVSNGVATSDEAAASLRDSVGLLRERVYDVFVRRDRIGATCDEVEAQTGLSHQTASARVYELHRADLIMRTNHRRPTRSGRSAYVYMIRRGI